MHTRILLITTATAVTATLVVLVVVLAIWHEPLLERIAERVDTAEQVGHSAAESVDVPVSDQEATVVDMVERANPAVVSIVVRREVPVYEQYIDPRDPLGGLFGGDPLRSPQRREQGTEWREVAGGSGFVVSPEGLVVTNRHVVADTSAEYSVAFSDGTVREVSVVAKDQVLDIAVLQIDERTDQESFSYLTFGDSEALRLGQTVVAIGNALAEFNNTVSVGVVSGLSRSITAQGRMGMAEQLDQVIQTDAAINPGNSGGPLLNVAGEVIGVNVATSLQGENIGFALPATVVARVVRSIEETGEIVRPFLGVRYAMLNERMANANDLPVSYGAIVLSGGQAADPAVLPDSPAAAAGLQEGDVIRAIDGRTLEQVSLAQVLRTKEVGDQVAIEVWRDGETFTTDTTLVAAP